MNDARRVCATCGQAFTWTEAEALALRAFLEAKGSVYSAPNRCQLCRAQARASELPGFVVGSCTRCGRPFACLEMVVAERRICPSCHERPRVSGGKG